MLLGVVLLACAASVTSKGAPKLRTMSLAPDGVSIARGQQQQFTVAGHYSDGSSVALTTGITWSSSDDGIASVDAGGLAHGVAAGRVTITATDGATGRSAAASLTVTAAVLDSIAIAPAGASVLPYQDRQFAAMSRFSDGTSAPLATGITWSSSDDRTATIDAGGLAHGVAAGAATITATHGATGLSATASLTVAAAMLDTVVVLPPTPSVAAGLTQQLTVTGHYSDGASAEIASGMSWSTSDDGIATIDAGGLARGVAKGTATLTATHGASGLWGTSSLTVTDAILQSIALSPNPASITVGVHRQMTATEHYSDGTTRVFDDRPIPIDYSLTWTTSNGAVATVGDTGYVNAVALGSATITVTDSMSGIWDSAPVTVIPVVLQSVGVEPPTASIAVGGSEPFTAIGEYSNGFGIMFLPGVTWSSSNGAVATVDAGGGAHGAAAGTVTITATHTASGLSGTATLTVTGP